MNASAWLRDRVAGVPAQLTETLQRVTAADGSAAPDALLRAAQRRLERVLEATPMTRAQALDLLAADAFATYALEAAADEPETLAERATTAMKLFADQVSSNA